MLETFEKDDTDMQSSGPDFVPTVLYDSLRKEFDELQERYSQAQAVAEASSVTGEQGYIRLPLAENIGVNILTPVSTCVLRRALSRCVQMHSGDGRGAG